MKTTPTTVDPAVVAESAQAPQPGLRRTDLQRHDLSAPGREMVQVRVDLDAGTVSPSIRIRAKKSSMSWKARWTMRSKASPR